MSAPENSNDERKGESVDNVTRTKVTYASVVAGESQPAQEKRGRLNKDLELSDLSGSGPSSSRRISESRRFVYMEQGKLGDEFDDEIKSPVPPFRVAVQPKESSQNGVGPHGQRGALKYPCVGESDAVPMVEVIGELTLSQGGKINYGERKYVKAEKGSKGSEEKAPIPKPRPSKAMKTDKSATLRTFPDVVNRVMSNSMGTVRRSSAIPIGVELGLGLNDKDSTTPSPTMEIAPRKPFRNRKIQVKPPTCEKGTQAGQSEEEDEDDDHEIEMEKSTPLRRRHSTGNINNVNAAKMAARIRQLQKRRHRQPKQSIAVRYIQYFLAFLFYAGLSPFKPASAKQLPKWILWTQTCAYWLFTTISVAEAIDEVKFGWIDFQVTGDLLTFVTLGYYAANLLTRIYYIKTMAQSTKATSTLLEKIAKVNDRGTASTCGRTSVIILAIGLLSVLIAILSTIFGNVPFGSWSFNSVLLDRSYDLSHSLFVWRTNDYKNLTGNLFREYGIKMSTTNGVLGVLGTVFSFFGTLHGCIILDIWPIISIQIYILQSHFSKAMERTKACRSKGRCPLSSHWIHYVKLVDVCDDNEHIFGKLMKFIHMQNMLLFGYFLLQLLKHTEINADILIDLFTVIKVSLTYYMVQKSADKNEEYEDCVVKCSGLRPTIEMNGVKVSVAVLLQNMKKHPVGVGRGDFFVDEIFVLRFVCAVGSIFMLLSTEMNDCKTQMSSG